MLLINSVKPVSCFLRVQMQSRTWISEFQMDPLVMLYNSSVRSVIHWIIVISGRTTRSWNIAPNCRIVVPKCLKRWIRKTDRTAVCWYFVQRAFRGRRPTYILKKLVQFFRINSAEFILVPPSNFKSLRQRLWQTSISFNSTTHKVEIR